LDGLLILVGNEIAKQKGYSLSTDTHFFETEEDFVSMKEHSQYLAHWFARFC